MEFLILVYYQRIFFVVVIPVLNFNMHSWLAPTAAAAPSHSKPHRSKHGAGAQDLEQELVQLRQN